MPTMSTEQKRARIAELKAQQEGGGGRSVASVPSNSKLSSARSGSEVKIQITSQPRKVNRDTHAECRIIEVTKSDVEGKRTLMPPTSPNSDFVIAPLTDEHGDYLCKYDSSYKKTDERKPVQLAEYGRTTVSISGAPDGPVDWATHPDLFPGTGKVITLTGAAVYNVFRQGTHLSGYFASAEPTGGDGHAHLDLEMPKLAFECVFNDEDLARRNIALSLDTGGWAQGWKGLPATNETKQLAFTTLSNQRSELLKPDSDFHKGLVASGEEGDEQWKVDVQKVSKGVSDSAPYQSRTGIGLNFDVAAHGPTVVVPIPALGTEFGMADRAPGTDSKAMHGEQDDAFFEGSLGDPGDRPVFGSSFKKGSERASGGPWLSVHIMAFAKAKGATKTVQLVSSANCVVLKMSLTALPEHVGSKCLKTIEKIATAFLPLTDMVVAFNTDRNNIDSNPKANESFDCRFHTIDFHSALLKYGIQLDLEMALSLFDERPVDLDSAEVTGTLTSCPKQFLACGFGLLNENMEARDETGLNQQAEQMKKILAFANRKAKCSIEIRAINPNGFEAHKASLEKLEKMDLVDRVAKVEADWPVYAVLKIDDEPPSTANSAEHEDKKQKK